MTGKTVGEEIEIARDALKLKSLEPKPWQKKCAFPKCKEIATTTYCQIPLCPKHVEWAEFQKWFHYKLGL